MVGKNTILNPNINYEIGDYEETVEHSNPNDIEGYISLEAQWEEVENIKFKVTYINDDDGDVLDEIDYEADYGDTLIPSSLVKQLTGYTYSFCELAISGKVDDVIYEIDDITKPITLTNQIVRFRLIYSPNVVTVVYRANGGIVTNNVFELYGDEIHYSSWMDRPYLGDVYYGRTYVPDHPDTFGLIKTGYKFAGWKVVGTDTILQPGKKYDSTVFTQYNDSSAATENTDYVDCYLEAQWVERINIIFNDNLVNNIIFNG